MLTDASSCRVLSWTRRVEARDGWCETPNLSVNHATTVGLQSVAHKSHTVVFLEPQRYTCSTKNRWSSAAFSPFVLSKGRKHSYHILGPTDLPARGVLLLFIFFAHLNLKSTSHQGLDQRTCQRGVFTWGGSFANSKLNPHRS